MADQAARERAVRDATERVRRGSVWSSRASSSGRFVTKKSNLRSDNAVQTAPKRPSKDDSKA